MLLQVSLALDDLTLALSRLTPLELDLHEEGGPERRLFIEPPEHLELVPDRGLRIATNARLRWTIAGVVIPVTVTSAQLLLLPELVTVNDRDALAFSFFVEHADLKHVPAFLDSKVVDEVNDALRKPDARPVWEFLDTLAIGFDLPPNIRPPSQRFELAPRWGALKITDQELVFSVSFQSKSAPASV